MLYRREALRLFCCAALASAPIVHADLAAEDEALHASAIDGIERSDTISHQQEPTHGQASLRPGFRLDSAVVLAGGSTDVSYLSSDCVGSAAVAPDYRLDLGGESAAGLGIRFVAEDSLADPTLVVRGPDGTFSCDDDGGLGLNPLVWLEAPDEGTYHIWAGTLDGTHADGVLLFTEGYGQLVPDAPPSFGEVVLPEGLLRLRGVTAGGRVDVSHLGPGCRGSAATAPVLRVEWIGESAAGLGVRFETTDGPDSDPTLIVRGPGGKYICVDDGPYGYDPSVWLVAPDRGRYGIWVGSYDGKNAEGTLVITMDAIDSDRRDDGDGDRGWPDHDAPPFAASATRASSTSGARPAGRSPGCCGSLRAGWTGCAQWPLRLLADKAVELGDVDSVSHETVRRVPKSTQQ